MIGDTYQLGNPASVSLPLLDDDDPPPGYTVDPAVVARVRALAAQSHHGAAHVNRWRRALAGLGALDPAAVSGGAMTAAQAQQMADTHSSPVWDEVAAELTALEAAAQQTPTPPPPPTPVVTIASDGDVAEGTSATFTLTASPAPAAGLDVTVTISASGDYGVTAGRQTVTIPTSGIAAVDWTD